MFLWGVALMVATACIAFSEPAPGRGSEKEEALAAGRAALEDGLYPMAQKEIERYIRKAASRTEKAQGTVLLAQALVGQGLPREAIQVLESRAEWAKDEETVAGMAYWRARAHFAAGDFGAAIKDVGDVARRFGGTSYQVPAYRLEAKSCLQLKQFDRAADILERLATNHPDVPEAPEHLLDWAAALLASDGQDRALMVLDRLVAGHPSSDEAAQARLWIGKLALERGDWTRAQDALAALSTQQAARVALKLDALFALASGYEARTNFNGAILALEQASVLAPDRAVSNQAGMARGKLLVRSGRTDEGIAVLRDAVRAEPGDPAAGRALLEVAQTLLDRGEFERSLAEFQNYLEAFSDKTDLPRALMGKGWSLWGLERYAEAAASFEKAYGQLTDPAERAQALFKAADAFFASRQFKVARDRYERVGREFPLDPLSPRAAFQAAECLAAQDSLRAAQDAFRELAESQPGTPLAEEAQMRMAHLQGEAGEWDRAMETYDRLIGACSNEVVCSRALHARGLIRYRQGLFSEALADFERVVRDTPRSDVAEQAFYMRGWCLYLLGNDKEALALCRQFVEKYPKSSWVGEVLFWLGEYHFNHGDYAEAEKQFMALADRDSKGALADAAVFWAGRAAVERKEYLRAIETFNKLAKNYPESPRLAEARFAQGDALSELGQFAGAILAFEEVINKFPGSYLVDLGWGRKGDCQFTLGKEDPKRFQEALASYQMVLGSRRAGRDLKAQAEHKMGRCHEKLGQREEALERYMNVVYAYLRDLEQGDAGSPVWFTRSAFNAAALKESEGQWREAVNIYKRVAQAAVPAAAEAQERIQKIRLEHWVIF